LRALLPEDFLAEAHQTAGVRRNNSLYTPLVTMCLMMMQRLHGGASLEYAVMELLRGLPASFWPAPCKRVLRWQQDGEGPSGNTAAFNQARQTLSASVVEQSCDHITDQLAAGMNQTGTEEQIRAFILDGSSVRTAHSAELCKLYPPAPNQHGEGHWPVLRVLVAHDLHTGLAMRPEWGAMFGEEAVSEQKLLERAIGRLPAGSTVLGDANFGVFSVAWAAQQRQHPVLLRLTAQRAKRLAGEPLRDGIDVAMVWQPSRDDRRAHPSLPADACLKGRLIVRQVQPDNGAAAFLLALFTTLEGPQEAILALYGKRWYIETDLRTLKSQLRLDQLTCATADMVAREINIATAAYNLVRAMIVLASQQSGIPPRQYSFTRVRLILQSFAPAIANAPDSEAAEKTFAQMMRYVQQAKLPRRKRKRPSYPRQRWSKGATFPNREH
jgi:putative transposase